MMSAIRLSTDCRYFSIPERCCAPCKAATHRFQHNKVAALDPAVANGGVERQWNRGRGRIRMLVDSHHDLFPGKPEFLRSRVEDSRIGLMRNDPVDVGRREACRL